MDAIAPATSAAKEGPETKKDASSEARIGRQGNPSFRTVHKAILPGKAAKPIRPPETSSI